MSKSGETKIYTSSFDIQDSNFVIQVKRLHAPSIRRWVLGAVQDLSHLVPLRLDLSKLLPDIVPLFKGSGLQGIFQCLHLLLKTIELLEEFKLEDDRSKDDDRIAT